MSFLEYPLGASEINTKTLGAHSYAHFQFGQAGTEEVMTNSLNLSWWFGLYFCSLRHICLVMWGFEYQDI